jgi:hypothetical protein
LMWLINSHSFPEFRELLLPFTNYFWFSFLAVLKIMFCLLHALLDCLILA